MHLVGAVVLNPLVRPWWCLMLQGGAAAEGMEEEAAPEAAAKEEADARSVFVNNVDFGTTPEELQQLFAGCGTVNRVTILADKFGTPKVRKLVGLALGGYLWLHLSALYLTAVTLWATAFASMRSTFHALLTTWLPAWQGGTTASVGRAAEQHSTHGRYTQLRLVQVDLMQGMPLQATALAAVSSR